MATVERVGAGELAATVRAFRDALVTHRERLNRLNVYPVPDGDTGTNMSLTLESVCAELDGAGDTLPDVCTAISHGSLMGARGNSGVILSQILRGVAEAFRADDADGGPTTLGAALERARAGAYAAVMRPVEGTILTVVSGAAAAAAAARGTCVDVLEAAKRGAEDALARTPDLLPALARAGVVDAGGAGFCLLVDAFLHVVDGRPLPDAPVLDEASLAATGATAADAALADAHDAVSDLRYEVMYFLEAPDVTVPKFKEVWSTIGDSIVVVGGDGLWNCHIHTDDIGAAVEAALDCGRPRNIRVTDLLEQVEEERWVREAEPQPEPEPEPVTTAVVAVGAGDGIGRIFRSLGVQRLVAGGQSMNPSTAQILEAVEAVPADHVVVLPNNKNIVPVASQVDALTDKTVRVVPTVAVAEGFAALLEYDPEAGIDANVAAMARAAERVVLGEVTQAVRDSSTPAGPIAAGDWLGLSRDGIEVVQPTLVEAVTALLEKLVTDDHEIVTLIEGDGAGAAVTRQVTEWLGEHRPNVTAEIHAGGQALYPYLLSIE